MELFIKIVTVLVVGYAILLTIITGAGLLFQLTIASDIVWSWCAGAGVALALRQAILPYRAH